MIGRWHVRRCALVMLVLCCLAGQPAAVVAAQAARAVAPTVLGGIPQSGEALGRGGARVVVTLYGDLECPICRQFVLSRAFAKLVSRDVRTGKLRIVYRSLCTATCNGPGFRMFVRQEVAAYAAGAQRRFWQYAMLFLARQGPEGTGYVTEAFLDRLARGVPGLRYRAWLAARKRAALAKRVRAENRAASKANIYATPTLVFSGPRGTRQLIGVPSFRQLSAAVAAVS